MKKYRGIHHVLKKRFSKRAEQMKA